MPSKQKIRLDNLIVQKGLAPTRQRAKALIMMGKVLVNQSVVDKPGQSINPDAQIRIKEGDTLLYVSRGAYKLKPALDRIENGIKGFVCMDVGASTGGFTDCLLQSGARKVYAIDVGYGQLAWKLRQDPRVIVLERTNIRYLSKDAITEKIDLVTIDTSFISLKIVVPSVLRFVKQDTLILALVKPQFEVGKGCVGKGGIVRDPAMHQRVLTDLSDFFEGIQIQTDFVMPSPIQGVKGNKEFIIKLIVKSVINGSTGPLKT